MSIKLHSLLAVAAVAAIAAGSAPAQASIYNNVFSVTVSEGVSTGGFDVAGGNPYAAATAGSNTASASFRYSGPLNFSNTTAQNSDASGDKNASFGFSAGNVSNYSTVAACATCNKVAVSGLGTVADYSTKASFLTSSGSAAGYLYGSYYTFDLGIVRAGTVLTITHDDGIALFQGSTRIGSTVSGPTSAVTDTVRVDSTADTILRYSRQNGTPSILQVAVPEPMSLAVLGAGLAAVGFVRRRRAG